MEGQPFLPIEVDSSSDEEDVSLPDENEEINWGEAQVLADVSHVQGHVYENKFTKKETIATIDADGKINEKQLTDYIMPSKHFVKTSIFRAFKVGTQRNRYLGELTHCWSTRSRTSLKFRSDKPLAGGSSCAGHMETSNPRRLTVMLLNMSNHSLLTVMKMYSAPFGPKLSVESMKEGLSLLLKDRMAQYNGLLARNLVGMTPENQGSRLGKFMKGWQSSIKKKFLPDCLMEFRMSESQRTRHLFITLENELYKTWNTSMNRYLLPEAVCNISEMEIENVVLQSGGLLYYIAGWVIHRLTKSTARVAPLAKRFAAHNTIAADSTSASITGVIDSREKHKGKLTRVSVEFFDYITLLEAIYKVNLDDPRKVWAYKDKLFPELLQLTTRSAQVDKYFGRCVPYDFSTDDKRDVLSYTLKIFCSMRAGDYIKSLRKKATDANKCFRRDKVVGTSESAFIQVTCGTHAVYLKNSRI